MSEFTKGKWEYWKNEKYPFWYVGIKGTKRYLATVDNEANARLTAAAPEMCKIISSLAGFESCPHEAWPDQEYLLRDLCRRSSHVLTRIDGEEVRNNE